VQARWEADLKEQARLAEEQRERQKRKTQEAREARERREREARELTDTLLGELLDGDDLERYRAGHMAEEEQRDVLREWAWGDRDQCNWYDALNRYTRLTKGDICNCDYPQRDFELEEDWEGPLSAAQWTTLKKIKDAFKEEYWVLGIRKHSGKCGNCDSEIHRLGVHVSRTVGIYTLSREYDLGDLEFDDDE
jgi:hypothetical protein